MKFTTLSRLLALSAAVACGSVHATATLKIGDPAPELKPAAWIKGEPVPAFQKGHVYVVEFWATWCGPCRMAFPHLSELAGKYAGKATFIGMDVREKGEEANLEHVKAFVEKQGAKMSYTIAMDEQSNDPIYYSWFRAAGLGGIPSAIIVGKDGNVVWVGSVMAGSPSGAELDQAVQQAIDGTIDLAAMMIKQEQIAAESAASRKEREPLQAITEAADRLDYAAVLREAEKLIAQDPKNEAQIMNQKLAALLNTDEKAGLDYLRARVADAEDNLQFFMGAAFTVVRQKHLSKSTYEFVIANLEKYRAEGKEISMELLAEAHFKAGNRAKAIEAQEAAIARVNVALEKETDADARFFTQDRLVRLKDKLEDYRGGKG